MSALGTDAPCSPSRIPRPPQRITVFMGYLRSFFLSRRRPVLLTPSQVEDDTVSGQRLKNQSRLSRLYLWAKRRCSSVGCPDAVGWMILSRWFKERAGVRLASRALGIKPLDGNRLGGQWARTAFKSLGPAQNCSLFGDRNAGRVANITCSVIRLAH